MIIVLLIICIQEFNIFKFSSNNRKQIYSMFNNAGVKPCEKTTEIAQVRKEIQTLKIEKLLLEDNNRLLLEQNDLHIAKINQLECATATQSKYVLYSVYNTVQSIECLLFYYCCY